MRNNDYLSFTTTPPPSKKKKWKACDTSISRRIFFFFYYFFFTKPISVNHEFETHLAYVIFTLLENKFNFVVK